mgnify:CR=1 FL=1
MNIDLLIATIPITTNKLFKNKEKERIYTVSKINKKVNSIVFN